MNGVETKEEKKPEPYWVQPKEEAEIAKRIYLELDKYRTNRNKSFPFFRERNCIDYWNESDQLFNNYRVKPEWKEEWQANISDITTHAKVMGISAQVVANRLKPEFYSRYSRDIFSKFKAQLYTDLYNFSDSVYRNGDMDDLFTVLSAARRGTVIGFEGWLKTKKYDGIDAQFIPLEDFYPQYINKFRIEDQDRCIWRTVAAKADADKVFSDEKKYPLYKHVKARGELQPDDLTFFNVSSDVEGDKVEILRWFDKIDDEFHISINGVLVTKPGSKLSDRRKDGELGFWKGVYEPFDYGFFYGRSLPDLMSDNQDAIDFLFNAMFDKTMLSVLTPIFTDSVNQLNDDYLQPAKIYNVTNADKTFQPRFDGPDAVSFEILKELQSRQNFISTDPQNQGIPSASRRTAHEVERVAEAAKKMLTLFTVLLQDALKMKAKLRMGTILQYMINRKDIKDIVIESTKLFKGNEGTKILRIKPEGKISPANQFGYSKKLAFENALIKGRYSEIVEFTPESIKNFEFNVDVRVPSTVEMSASLQKAYNRDFFLVGLSRPDIFKQREIGRGMAMDANKEVERFVIADEEEGEPSPTDLAMMGAGGGNTNIRKGAGAAPKPLKELAMEGSL